ncbi:hypothetical protein EMIT0158MI4_40557 [Burkholderia ambifaria]
MLNSASCVIADAQTWISEFLANDLLSPIVPKRERPHRVPRPLAPRRGSYQACKETKAKRKK